MVTDSPTDLPTFPLSAPRNIILVGFMGTGKTSVGRALAGMMEWEFVDTDTLTEQRVRRTVSEIFREMGEDGFRRHETETLRRLRQKTGLVIATGGGIVLRDENIALMEEIGAVFRLDASMETLKSRLLRDVRGRPLLAQSADPEAKICELLDARRERYSKIQRSVATDGLTPKQVAERLLDEVGMQEKVKENGPAGS